MVTKETVGSYKGCFRSFRRSTCYWRAYPKEYFLLAPSTTTMAAQSLATFTSSFWIELPGVNRPTRTT